MMTTRSRPISDEVKATPEAYGGEGAAGAGLPFTALIWGAGVGYNGARPLLLQGDLMLVLRSNPASPFVRKVRIVAALLDLDGRIELSNADTSDQADSLRVQNPLGKIPALILENGEVFYDSAVIVEYLDGLAGGGRVIPADPARRFRSLTRQALGDGICEAAVLLRYEQLWREPAQRSEKWMAYQRDKIDRALAASEKDPPEELDDVGTVALACALGYLDLRFGGDWRGRRPKLVEWLEVFSEATPSFEATRLKG